MTSRNIDIHQGRDRLFLASKKISQILSKDFIRMVPEHSVQEMIDILAKADNSEGYIISPKGKLLGKISITALIRQEEKQKQPKENLYNKYLVLNESDSVLEAIDAVKDFVGESIPVISNNGDIIGIITESDLFSSLILAEKERNEEELG